MDHGTTVELPSGSILDERYEVRETIATGGMGRVYLAHSVALGVPLALKMLRPELAGTPEALARFRREALLASEVRHPNIVRVVDFVSRDHGPLYLVMEYVAGPSLAELLRREGRQPIARVVSFMRQLLAALEELHANGIAHGDVTSTNLLLQPMTNGDARLKLVDFGLARRIAPVGDPPAIRDLLICGTPGYMAPEVQRGEPITPAADIFSAGVVLHELLTGELPGALPGHVHAVTLRGSPELLRIPRQPWHQLPSRFGALLARALCVVAADRLEAGALSAALARAADGLDPALVLPPLHAVTRDAHARDHVPTAVVRARVFVDPGAPTRVQQLRERIGKAMRKGNVDHMADLYRGLAELLRDSGDPAAAMGELAEAISVLGFAGGKVAGQGPAELWRLHLLLAQLQARSDAIADARVSAEIAYRHAALVSSRRGRDAALALLRRLRSDAEPEPDGAAGDTLPDFT